MNFRKFFKEIADIVRPQSCPNCGGREVQPDPTQPIGSPECCCFTCGHEWNEIVRQCAQKAARDKDHKDQMKCLREKWERQTNGSGRKKERATA